MHAIGATVTLDIAALIAAVVWPAVLVVLALTYRQAIRDSAQAALRRGFKVGFPSGWSFELPGAREAPIRWLSGRAEVDLRRPVSSADITDSTRAEFSAQLQDRTPAEYARVDLGYGQEWLSSRLYFMSIALSRLRGLVAFVFVDSVEGTSQHFVGWAQLADVRWALANRFPRLERAFLDASCDLASNSNLVLGRGETLFAPPPSQPTTVLGSQPSSEAPADLLAGFLNHIQLPVPPSPEEAIEWVPYRRHQPASPPRRSCMSTDIGWTLRCCVMCWVRSS
jgi:hypothetical protein